MPHRAENEVPNQNQPAKNPVIYNIFPITLLRTPGKATMARKPKSTSTPTNRAGDSATSTIRIIGGKLRGQTIQYSGDARTRPMKDRVREATFNLVGPAIKKRLVIDLFAGTGAIGLEALSRGASQAILLEQHFPTARLIEQNVTSLKLDEQVEVIGTDTFYWVKHRMPKHEFVTGNTPWVVFCSPPYLFYTERWTDMEQLIQTICKLAPPQSLLVLETDQHLDLTNLPCPDEWDIRNYPPAVLGILTIQNNAD